MVGYRVTVLDHFVCIEQILFIMHTCKLTRIMIVIYTCLAILISRMHWYQCHCKLHFTDFRKNLYVTEDAVL